MLDYSSRARPVARSNARNISGWAAGLRNKGLIDLAGQFPAASAENGTLLRALGLPCYGYHLVSCSTFVKRRLWFKRHFRHDRYYLTLIPQTNDIPKLSLLDFTNLEAAYQFVSENVRPPYTNYSALISEIRDNIFGGTILSDGTTIVSEIAPGYQTQVSQGSAAIVYGILSDLTISAKYSTEDPTLRELLWRSMLRVADIARRFAPEALVTRQLQFDRIRSYTFARGYFEFAYTRRSRQQLDLIFFDVKLDPIYWTMPSSFALALPLMRC